MALSCVSTVMLATPYHYLSSPFPVSTSSCCCASRIVKSKWRMNVSFFPSLIKKDANLIKQELLEAIHPLDRGAEATPQDQQIVDQITRKLEAVNPTKAPLKSELLNGKWELLYTTSASILQITVTADLTPVNAKKVAVKFDFFKIGGLIPVKAPDRAVGALEITYLDEDLRVSRGDKGNLFILKMVDPSYRVPASG
ncbi:putative plastid-lipid-associated protein 4, chloroplastic isoform X3 [Apium graveolens]|uniref:putative plastid-lipid-associated protein 4, chloroplastic isoform X3 n=1 Tax=Apium graveolens TaxID=4045 RepID=UPI003D79660C